MADGEATPAPTLKRGLPAMYLTKEQKKSIRARRALEKLNTLRKRSEEYKQKEKEKKISQKKTGLGRWFGIYEEEEEEFMEMVKGYKPNIRGSIIKDKTDTRPRSEKIETTQGVQRRSSVDVGNSNYKRAIKREKEQRINKIYKGAAKIIAGKNDKSIRGRWNYNRRINKYNKRLKEAQKDGRLLSRRSGKSLYKLKF